MAGAGDVNGDGYDDVIVGDSSVDAGAGMGANGAVDVYYGSSSGLSTSASWSVSKPSSNLGYDVAGVGDLNDDGYDDVAVGNPGSANCPVSKASGPDGQVIVFYGSSSGLSQGSSWSNSDGVSAISCLGQSVAGAGDVDGDGVDDLVVSAPTYPNGQMPAGRVFVYRGSSSGVGSSPDWAGVQSAAMSNSIFGSRVSTAGDVNADGYDDILVAASADYGNGKEARFFVYRGGASGVAASPSWSYSMAGSLAGIGEIAGPGDIDGDGFSDIVIWTGESSVAMHHGLGSGVYDAAAWDLAQAGIGYGISVDGAGDVDNDGRADVIFGTDGRGAIIFRGGANPAPQARDSAFTVRRGTSVELTLRADDVHGDPLQYRLVSRPNHGSVTDFDVKGGTLRYSAGGQYVGMDSLDFEAEDPYGNTDSASVTFTIEGMNDPPEFVPPTPETDQTVFIGETLEFQVAAEDPDGDDVSLSSSRLFEGASFDAQSGEFQYTPEQAGIGQQVTFLADDGQDQATHTVQIWVEKPPMDTGVMPDTRTVDTGMEIDVLESEADVPKSDDAEAAPDVEPSADASSGGSGCTSAGSDVPVSPALLVLVVLIPVARIFE